MFMSIMEELTISHMGTGILWKIIVTQHSLPLHQEM